MIIDTMTKYEVMKSLRKEFDEEVLPHYEQRIKPALFKLLSPRFKRDKKKQTVNLGWTNYSTKSQTEFKILKRGNIESDLPLFVCEFRWRNRYCYGNFFEEGNVVIFQSHCLQRYAERVLQTTTEIKEVFYKYILKSQSEAYQIVLPTPTHKYSHYFGIADALFLGDYEKELLDDNFMWCNTCISYNETKFSQLRITKSLLEIQQFVRKYRIDYCNINNKDKLDNFFNEIANDNAIESFKEFVIKKYLLWQLHLSFKFDFTEHFRTKIDETLGYIEKMLKSLGINPKSLSPYSKIQGIAWKGEIDFRES